MQIRKAFQHKYPHIPIMGSNFEPSSQKKTAANMVKLATYSAIGLTIGGDQLFQFLGTQPPAAGSSLGDVYKAMRENKFYTCAGSYFVGNTISENMLSTGAFEIYYDGKLVFSKLQTGRLPRIDEIMTNMDHAIGSGDSFFTQKIGLDAYQY